MAYTLYESDFTQRTNAVVDRFTDVEGPLLPILHGLQEEFGHVPESSLRVVADRLNLSRAEVHGVATFYHDFRTAPAGRHTLKICRAEACQAMGSDRLAERERTAVAGNMDPRGHERASLMSESSFSSSTRPTTRPSIIAAGESAQSPRQ